MPTITREMIDVLNNQLAGAGAAYRIIPRDEYRDVDYDAAVKVQHTTPIRSPFLVDQVQYTNCTSSQQTITDTVSRSLETSSTWYIKAGFKIGISVKASAGVIFAGVETSISAELSVEGGYSETKKETLQIQSELPLIVKPMTKVTRQALVEQQEVEGLPFVVDIVLRRGVFDFAPAGVAPLYRYYNGGNGDHFYTTSHGELGDGRDGYASEGVAGNVYLTQQPGTVPLYRYYNGGDGDHFYTTSHDEPGGGYVFEGIECYVLASQLPNTIPLYRYYNGSNGDHFYTTSRDELGSGRDGYALEGIECYLPASEARMDIVRLLPNESQRAFQAQGTFSGKAIDRRVEILVSESPVTDAACSILAKGGQGATLPGVPAVRGLYATRAAPTSLARIARLRAGMRNVRAVAPR